MSAAGGASRRPHLRVLGLIAGALFGVAGVLVPLALIQIGAVLAGISTLGGPGGWLGLVLPVAALIAGAALSVLWLRHVGVRSAARVTAIAGLLSVCAGWLSLIALTPVLGLLQALGVLLADTDAMSLLPVLAAALGAIAGLLLWPSFARGPGGAPGLTPAH